MVDKERLLSLRRSALTGNVAALIAALVSLSLATLMVARIGGPSAVGDYALLRVMPWLLAVVVSGGLAAATPWFLAGPTRDNPHVKMTIMAIAVVAAVVSLVVWVGASPFLRELFFRDLTTAIVAFAGLKTISRLFVITAKSASQGSGDLPGTNYAIALEEFLFIPAYAVALLLGLSDGAAVVAALIGGDVVTGAIAWRRLIGRHYFAGVARPSLDLAKKIYIFGLRGQVGSIAYLVNLRLDFMIVDLLAGPAILGIYAVASKFAELVRLLPISFEWVLYPGFARKTGAEAWSWAAWLAPRAAAGTALAALPLAVLAMPIIPLFYGSAFTTAVEPTRLLLIGLSVEGASGVITAYLFGRGRPGLNSIATFGGVLATVALDLLLIPRYSLIGASIASTIAYLTTTSLLGLCFLLLQPRSLQVVIDVGEAIRPGRFRRTLDVVAAAAALVVLSPVMLVAWLGARLSTGASGIYRQVRVGEGGTAFTMLKFRSMRSTEGGPEVTASRDRRVTRLGRVLRATSIDELPQLINVLRGEMTLVGARPETVSLAQRYPESLQRVFRYRPGLTGPAQLRLRQSDGIDPSGDVEAAYLSTQVPARVAQDLEYLTNPTPLRTFAEIAATLAYVLRGGLPVSRRWRAMSHARSSSHAPDRPWRLLTSPSAVQIDLRGSAEARRRLRERVLHLSPGTDVVVSCRAFTSHWRSRAFLRDAGVEIVREYVAIPSLTAPTCYVENTELALRYFFTQVSALPGGGAFISALLAAAKRAATYVFPASLIGLLAPTRIIVGRVPGARMGDGLAARNRHHHQLEASGLLTVPGMEAIVLAVSKDPNAKLTVLLLPEGQPKPVKAVKVPTTETAKGSVLAERWLLEELRSDLPDDLLATIPRPDPHATDRETNPMLVVSALPGSPMSTRYHGWRHVATRSAVESDFKMVGDWLMRFQSATAFTPRPIDMDGGVTEILRARFADDPEFSGVIQRLRTTLVRLSMSQTPSTAVHGDFWFGNVLTIGEKVSGVIDWEAGSMSGEPVRDVARFALTYALYLDRHSPVGGRVAGHRGLRTGVWGSGIEFALEGDGWFPALVRTFIRASLSRLGADPELWRDAALAGIAEVAATADHEAFARLHWELFGRLSGGPADQAAVLRLEPAKAFAHASVSPSDVA